MYGTNKFVKLSPKDNEGRNIGTREISWIVNWWRKEDLLEKETETTDLEEWRELVR